VFLAAVRVVVEVQQEPLLLVLPMVALAVMEEVVVHIQQTEEGEIPVVPQMVEVTRVTVKMVLVD
tara:strand:+ start:76 stop:270 length:195 start_codon:yes stop_codon:yes gene_type:complete